MQFTDILSKELKPIFDKITNHNFVIELFNGSLDKKCFEKYLSQDALYLIDDAMALETVAERSNDEETKDFFKILANDIIVLEKLLHKDYFPYFNITKAINKSKVITDYTNHLLHHATNSPIEVACSALLPCFWAYTYVGQNIKEFNEKDNFYIKWAETYKSQEYVDFTTKFLEITNKLAANTDEKNKKEMIKVAKESSQYELDFFSESYKI